MNTSYTTLENVERRQSGHTIYGALAVANFELVPQHTQVTITALPEGHERAVGHPGVKFVRSERRGIWAVPAELRLVLGVERVVRAERSSQVSLGQEGIISRALFERLRDGKPVDKRQNLPLLPGEVRQVLVEIVRSESVRSHDFYVLHVLHTAEGVVLRDQIIVVDGEHACHES